MTLRVTARWLVVSSMLVLGVLVGCLGDRRRDLPPEAAPPRRAGMSDAVIAGTIGSETLLSDVDTRALRGFGLVIGLRGDGSGDCPTVIRDYLIDFLAKQVGPQGGGRKPRRSPGGLIDSPDTAVVQVIGYVPAGARSGTRFDLQVQALPGTATRSLEGGLLLPTELRMFDRSASGHGMVTGAVLAQAGGPVFVNPFADPDAPTATADPRRGTVLGGGRCKEDRPARLMLIRPNYQLARTMERRVNERFGQRPRAAEARSRGYVVLTTPPQYASFPRRFRDLVAHIYVDNNPAFRDRKRAELIRLAAGGGERLEPIALAWEGFGQTIIPHIRAFYADPDPTLRFYAARTGTRLGDSGAVGVLADVAASRDDPRRLLAVRELGDCDSPQAALRLVPLLNAADQELRIAAYEALLRHAHPAIRSVQFRSYLDRSQLNCILDIVECDGPPLVYVRRTRLPRIAVFGREVPVVPPVFYTCPDGAVTLVSVEDGRDIRIYSKQNDRLTDEIVVPPVLADVVTALAGLPRRDDAGQLCGVGLPYSRVIQVLATLCEQRAIPARLVLEQTSLTEILGPDERPERPEQDERPESELQSQQPPAEQRELAAPARRSEESS